MLLSGKTLYLCYFWLDTPLVQTQVLPYLREIALGGVKVHLLTFEREKLSAEQIEENRKQLADDGIIWSFLTYHKRFSVPATFYDVLCGAFFAWKLARKEKIDVFHARVHIPAMMGWIANKFLRRKPKLLFDIRGFFPEEYVDAGIWKADSSVYKAVKYCEKLLLRDSDGFVTLTEKAREILFPESKETGFDKLGRPVEVIPCCVDLNKFAVVNQNLRDEMRRKLNIENRFVIVYVGSFGGFYMTEETADFYGMAKQKHPNAFALILTQSEPKMIQPLLEKYGYTEKDFFIQKISPKEMPDYLSAADVSLSFIKPSFSKLASSPTKNAEYLACGLPMIANSKVGDTEEFTNADEVGFIINEFTVAEYEKALIAVEKMLENRAATDLKCKESAKKRFDLQEVGGKNYLNLYRKLLK
jgi:glycosyltransferase involved in cell wall biosynthesis